MRRERGCPSPSGRAVASAFIVVVLGLVGLAPLSAPTILADDASPTPSMTPSPGPISPSPSPSASPFATPAPAPTVGPSAPPTATPGPTPTPTPTLDPTAAPTAAPAAATAPTPTPSPAPSFTTTASVSPTSVAAGGTITITALVTSATETDALVDIVVYAPNGTTVAYQQYRDNQSFAAGQQRSYPIGWQVPATTIAGTYLVSLGIFAPAWASLYSWQDRTVSFAVTGPVPPIHAQGNRIVDAWGQPVVLRGVNRAGTEYACIHGWSIGEGPRDQASIDAMLSWHVNVVRIPLNEDCWLAVNGAPPEFSGGAYQQAIKDYVNLLNLNGMYAILDLSWSGPGSVPATGQVAMPDALHAAAFWSSVASVFKGNDAAIFEIFNEPWPDGDADSPEAWRCWRDGGTCAGVPFATAGMQTLVDAVRETGATNLILLGGVSYSNALSGWLNYRPTDPRNDLAAAWHVYGITRCASVDCYNATVAPVAAQVPVVATEIGDVSCDRTFLDALMTWLDTHQAGYVAFTWNLWGTSCQDWSLILDYSGAPTTKGQIYRAHLAAVR
jgi:hypothetical protein